ncbi:hypothetical protein ABW20_dc0107305 [Dactylellina cionopaga]|nr:hypothetical protein ABW20_dc0107305 [Dactylellina cionopaga]
MSRPTAAAFLIPEILEMIMLEVPAIELLTACRQVCKGWKSILETSPALSYYATTGRRRRKNREDEQEPCQIVTPLAVEILTHFWRKLARKGINEQLEVQINAPGGRRRRTGSEVWAPIRFASRIYKHMLEPPVEKDRRELRIAIRELYDMFYPITKKIPFIDPELEGASNTPVFVFETSNWAYIRRQEGIDPLRELYTELHNDNPSQSNCERRIVKPWWDALIEMVLTVYMRSPKQTISANGNAPRLVPGRKASNVSYEVVLENKDARGRRKVYRERLFFAGNEPFARSVISIFEISNLEAA